MEYQDTPIRTGVVGTGYVSSHFVEMAARRDDLTISRVLTRREPARCTQFPRQNLLTRSTPDLLEHSDVIFECSGDPIHAADVVDAACEAALPVVTINAEFHVTAGSYFVDKGLVTEAEGDQPGSLAALHERATDMGFTPVVYGNLKGFLNHTPTPEEMRYWADKKNVALDKVTSFTDGTKLQVEQALVANRFDATIAEPGMLGPEIDDIEAGGEWLARQAADLDHPIADYLLFSNAPHGIFIAAEHSFAAPDFFEHVKLGSGPFYLLGQNHVLVHLEVPRTIRRVHRHGKSLLHNSKNPQINVAAVAKTSLSSGTTIDRGIGSFELRGECVRISERPNVVPIGLMQNAVVRHSLEPNQYVTFSDVDLPDTTALHAWQKTIDAVLDREAKETEMAGTTR